MSEKEFLTNTTLATYQMASFPLSNEVEHSGVLNKGELSLHKYWNTF